MTLFEVVRELGLKVKIGSDRLDREITGGYSSDLLSDVMAHGEAGNIWVTLQAHPNVIAVASLKDLAGIILVNGREPDEETAVKGAEEGIPVMVSDLPTFELVGKLYALGIPGRA
jgi:hypothetical protein